MRSREHFWQRVDGALDARRDPLADPAVRSWAAGHPDDRRELGRLLSRLDLLSPASPIPAQLRRGTLALFVAALLLFAPLSLIAPERAVEAPRAGASLAAAGRFELYAVRHEPGRRVTLESAAGRTIERETSISGVVRTRATAAPPSLARTP